MIFQTKFRILFPIISIVRFLIVEFGVRISDLVFSVTWQWNLNQLISDPIFVSLLFSILILNTLSCKSKDFLETINIFFLFLKILINWLTVTILFQNWNFDLFFFSVNNFLFLFFILYHFLSFLFHLPHVNHQLDGESNVTWQ